MDRSCSMHMDAKNLCKISVGKSEGKIPERGHFRHLRTDGRKEIGINRLKAKLVHIILKNSVRTSKRTQHFTIT
jgi:hypothetical protein